MRNFLAALISALRGVSFLASGGIAAGVSLAMLGASWSIPKERSASPCKRIP
jgi:hypothetical protein